MKKNKYWYNGRDYYYCDQSNNCAQCNQKYNSVCSWFDNKYEHGPDDKLPIIIYEYEKECKN